MPPPQQMQQGCGKMPPQGYGQQMPPQQGYGQMPPQTSARAEEVKVAGTRRTVSAKVCVGEGRVGSGRAGGGRVGCSLSS